MQQYKAIWTPSPTAYMVDKHQWIGKLNGGGETVLVDNIPASAGSMTYNFADNVVVEAWLRTFGDNGTTADTSHVTFTAKNLQNVAPVGNFAIAWVQNVP